MRGRRGRDNPTNYAVGQILANDPDRASLAGVFDPPKLLRLLAHLVFVVFVPAQHGRRAANVLP